MDSMADIDSPWIDPEQPHFPDNHPGLGDVEYMRRRRMFFYLARDHRLRDLNAPHVQYVEEESALWHQIYDRLDELHQQVAADVYLRGKESLGLRAGQIPQLTELQDKLHRQTRVHLVPAEGLLHGKTYFSLWADRVMPCTQFLRHASQPEYTPEPDIIHDVIGHVPPLMDGPYVRLIEQIGQAARRASDEQLEQLVRFYWFTIEFGLLREAVQTKILGAGILSSIGEIDNVVSGQAEQIEFELQRVLDTAFDTTHLQPTLFVAPSLEVLVDAAQELTADW